MDWTTGERVTYARHLPDEPNVQRMNDDRDIGKPGTVVEVVRASCYGHDAYKVLWDEPYRPFGAIGVWCASEQLEALASVLP